MGIVIFIAVVILAPIALLGWVNRGNRGSFRRDANAIDDVYAGRPLHRPYDPSDRRHRRP